jgi:hypothetical protein
MDWLSRIVIFELNKEEERSRQQSVHVRFLVIIFISPEIRFLRRGNLIFFKPIVNTGRCKFILLKIVWEVYLVCKLEAIGKEEFLFEDSTNISTASI